MIYNPDKLQKIAFSPFTEDAQMAAQQPMMPPQGGMSPQQPPMDPTMQGGMPPQGGAPAPIQTVPGPNGEPIDPETGFIVIDPQQGIEQDPFTGILFNKFTQEFMTPDGQPMDPNQAMQMIEQAMSQAQGMDSSMQGMPPQDAQPPMDPAMMGGMQPQGEQPVMPQQGAGQTFDPATGQMIDDATGMLVDQSTGMLVDPSTGQMIDPNTGAIAPSAQQMPMFDDPEIMAQVQDVLKEVPSMSKELARVEKQNNQVRTDLQGLRREIQTLNDNQDAVLSRIDNATALIEQLMGAR
jgi:hypothetical protein